MPGVTKHIYDREIIDINAMWNNQLKKIEKRRAVYFRDNLK